MFQRERKLPKYSTFLIPSGAVIHFCPSFQKEQREMGFTATSHSPDRGAKKESEGMPIKRERSRDKGEDEFKHSED